MDIINKNIGLKYIEETQDGYRLTPKGLDYANIVMMDFI